MKICGGENILALFCYNVYFFRALSFFIDLVGTMLKQKYKRISRYYAFLYFKEKDLQIYCCLCLQRQL